MTGSRVLTKWVSGIFLGLAICTIIGALAKPYFESVALTTIYLYPLFGLNILIGFAFSAVVLVLFLAIFGFLGRAIMAMIAGVLGFGSFGGSPHASDDLSHIKQKYIDGDISEQELEREIGKLLAEENND